MTSTNVKVVLWSGHSPELRRIGTVKISVAVTALFPKGDVTRSTYIEIIKPLLNVTTF